jgi:hypothetical protein
MEGEYGKNLDDVAEVFVTTVLEWSFGSDVMVSNMEYVAKSVKECGLVPSFSLCLAVIVALQNRETR